MSMLTMGSKPDRQETLKACIAGMVDHLYKGAWGSYKNGGYQERQIDKQSVVTSGEWVTGKPITITGKGKKGPYTIHLITQVSKVDPMWLAEIAPQLSEEKAHLRPCFVPEIDAVESDTEVYFNGQLIGTYKYLDRNHPDAAEIFCSYLAGQMTI